MANKGGKRPGAGRKPGSRTKAQQAIVDVASQVLGEINQVASWKKLCRSKDQRVALAALQYLTDRAHGKARQPLSGDPDHPILAKLILVDAGAVEPKK